MGEAHRLRAIGRIPYHVQCGVEVQEGAQSPSNDLMVVGYQNAYALI